MAWIPLTLLLVLALFLAKVGAVSATVTVTPSVRFYLPSYGTYVQFSTQRSVDYLELTTTKFIVYGATEDYDVVWYSVKHANLLVKDVGAVNEKTTTFSMETHYDASLGGDFAIVNFSVAGSTSNIGGFSVSIDDCVDGDAVQVSSLTELDAEDRSCYYINATYFVAKVRHRIVSGATETVNSIITIYLSQTESPGPPEGGIPSNQYTLSIRTLYGGEPLKYVLVKIFHQDTGALYYDGLTNQYGWLNVTLTADRYRVIAYYEDEEREANVYLIQDETLTFDFSPTGSPVAVESLPEVSQWGIPLLALLVLPILVGGFWFMKRRRRRRPRPHTGEGVYLP